jgi:hypothetical protein
MAKLRSDPNKDLSLVQERLNQFFKEALYSGMGKDAEQGSAFVPPVDILETKDEVVLKAELPGVLKENIDIQMSWSSRERENSKRKWAMRIFTGWNVLMEHFRGPLPFLKVSRKTRYKPTLTGEFWRSGSQKKLKKRKNG